MIGFVVEDNALRHIVLAVSQKLRIQAPPNPVRIMWGDDLRKGKSFAQEFFQRKGCRKVIVLKDRQGPPFRIEERFQQEGFPRESSLVVAEQEAESWFLADEEALSDYLGGRVNRIPNPESLAHPKETLKELFRRHRRRSLPYHEGGSDPQELASRINPEVVAQRCPSFQRLLDAIRS